MTGSQSEAIKLLDYLGKLAVASEEEGDIQHRNDLVRGAGTWVKRAIASNLNLDVKDARGKTALMWCCHLNGCGRYAKDLMDAGVGLNVQDDNGWSALHYAIRKREMTQEDTAIVRELVEAKINLDLQDDFGHTALMVAAKTNENAVCTILANAGADLDCQDEWGKTALMIAAQQDCLESVHCLIDVDCSLDLMDKNNMTALMWCCGKEVAALLLNAGCDLSIVDSKGRDAEQVQEDRKRDYIVKLIRLQKAKAVAEMKSSIDNGGSLCPVC